MDNSRGWTDWNLEKTREEMGAVEAIPVNKAPSYENSEHKYLKRSDKPVMLGEASEPGYKSSEHYYMEHGDRPVMLGESSEPGYKSSEHYYSDGFMTGIGYNINGEKVEDLIRKGVLTPSNIKPEEKEIICKDIMCGQTRDKNMLASKLGLLLNDKEIINTILYSQYREAVKEIDKEKRGSYRKDIVNRKFQFLVTSKILIEKGYDIQNIKFGNENSRDFVNILSDFRKQSSGTSLIDDPSWFMDGKTPEGYDLRRVNSASLFAGSLLIDIYKKNSEIFKEKYEQYKSMTNLEPISYEQFMERYGIFPNVISSVEESFGGMKM